MKEFDPESDLFKKNNLESLLSYYKQQTDLFKTLGNPRLNGLSGNVETRHPSCLQDIVFGPEFSRLEIRHFDEKILKNALDMKPGPIPGFDQSIIYGTKSFETDQALNPAKKMKKVETMKKRPFLPQTISHF